MPHEDSNRIVVKAKSWDEIFSDKELEALHFWKLVSYFVSQYGEDLASHDTAKLKTGEKFMEVKKYNLLLGILIINFQ